MCTLRNSPCAVTVSILLLGSPAVLDRSTEFTTNANLPSRTSWPTIARAGGVDGRLPASELGPAPIRWEPVFDDDWDAEWPGALWEAISPMAITTAMTAKTMTHLGTGCFFLGGVGAPAPGRATGPHLLPSQ